MLSPWRLRKIRSSAAFLGVTAIASPASTSGAVPSLALTVLGRIDGSGAAVWICPGGNIGWGWGRETVSIPNLAQTTGVPELAGVSLPSVTGVTRQPLTQHRKQRGIVHPDAAIDIITRPRKPVAPFKLIELLPPWRKRLSGSWGK